MYKIVEATEKQTKDIARFQVDMAMETEKLKLDYELVLGAVDFLDKNKGYGQFYVGLSNEGEECCGSMLVTT